MPSTSAMRKSAPRIAGKEARPVEDKPAREIKFQRLTADVYPLVAPRGFRATVLLRFVNKKDGHRHYSILAMVGQNDASKVNTAFKFTGEETVRFDVPSGVSVCASSLVPALQQYVRQNIPAEQRGNDPPIIDD
jgi:hypothetical protein